MWGTKEMMVPIDIDFHSMEKSMRKSMWTINYLATHILQNIFFCVKQKK